MTIHTLARLTGGLDNDKRSIKISLKKNKMIFVMVEASSHVFQPINNEIRERGDT